jgi:hypothetical protein
MLNRGRLICYRGRGSYVPGFLICNQGPREGLSCVQPGVEGINIAILGPRPREGRLWKNNEKPRLPGAAAKMANCFIMRSLVGVLLTNPRPARPSLGVHPPVRTGSRCLPIRLRLYTAV